MSQKRYSSSDELQRDGYEVTTDVIEDLKSSADRSFKNMIGDDSADPSARWTVMCDNYSHTMVFNEFHIGLDEIKSSSRDISFLSLSLQRDGDTIEFKFYSTGKITLIVVSGHEDHDLERRRLLDSLERCRNTHSPNLYKFLNMKLSYPLINMVCGVALLVPLGKYYKHSNHEEQAEPGSVKSKEWFNGEFDSVLKSGTTEEKLNLLLEAEHTRLNDDAWIDGPMLPVILISLVVGLVLPFLVLHLERTIMKRAFFSFNGRDESLEVLFWWKKVLWVILAGVLTSVVGGLVV